MNLQIEIPEKIFKLGNADVSHEILEAVALEGFKSDQLSAAQVMRILGFETRLEAYEFLAKHGVPWVNYSIEDVERERKLLKKLIP
jgi:hypothetical protein